MRRRTRRTLHRYTAYDADLAPLRDRDDFRALVADLWDRLDRAFPADPFAP